MEERRRLPTIRCSAQSVLERALHHRPGDDGQRITSTINGEPLKADGTYTVPGLLTFLLDGGDSFDALLRTAVTGGRTVTHSAITWPPIRPRRIRLSTLRWPGLRAVFIDRPCPPSRSR